MPGHQIEIINSDARRLRMNCLERFTAGSRASGVVAGCVSEACCRPLPPSREGRAGTDPRVRRAARTTTASSVSCPRHPSRPFTIDRPESMTLYAGGVPNVTSEGNFLSRPALDDVQSGPRCTAAVGTRMTSLSVFSRSAHDE